MLSWWPEHPTKSFFAGKKASCVLGVRNTGQDRVNVTYAVANLASPYNASMNLFNFTGQVGVTAGWGGDRKEQLPMRRKEGGPPCGCSVPLRTSAPTRGSRLCLQPLAGSVQE